MGDNGADVAIRSAHIMVLLLCLNVEVWSTGRQETSNTGRYLPKPMAQRGIVRW